MVNQAVPGAAVLLAAGFLIAPAAAGQEAAPRPTFPELPADAPAGTGSVRSCLEEVVGEMRCGRYRVYEDREARSGRTIDLAFVVAEALAPDADRDDAITYFFGGPGTSAVDLAPAFASWRTDLRQQRDLLFVDFRGVGHSDALDCDVPYPGGVESRFGALFPVDHVVACRDRLAERAQLDLYTSNHTMDDLDELRAWLGYEALNLVGGSYGSREIQVFLRRHPDAARAAVLTAVSPIFEGGYVTHARGLQDALDEVVVECAADAACAEAYPDLADTLEQVLERVRQDPPRVVAEGARVRFGPGELGYALRGLLYQRGVEVPLFLYRAAAGDWQPLVDYYLARSGWAGERGGNAGMHFSVLCAEDMARLDPETVATETAGTFLGDHLIGAYMDVCEVWPHAGLGESFWEPVQSDVPVLLFSGSRDPVTPPSGGEAVARYLPHSLHVVVPGAGHGVGGPCIRELERQFLETASVEGLDTSCLQERPPPEFALPGEQ